MLFLYFPFESNKNTEATNREDRGQISDTINEKIPGRQKKPEIQQKTYLVS